MKLYQDYMKLKQDSFYKKELYKKIFKIFEGKGGEQIVTEQIVQKNTRIRDMLVMSPELERALNYTLSGLQNLVKNEHEYSDSLFYFCQYGGSKTQFLNVVKSEIWNNSPQCIPILLEDLNSIKVQTIFEKMIGQLLKRASILPKFERDPILYDEFIVEINKKISDVHVSFNQSNNLIKIKEIISKLERKRNIEIKDNVRELNEIVHSTIMVDKVDILNNIIELMRTCSKHDLSFLFMFDEVDLWLDTDADRPQFSKKFLTKHIFMKKLLEIPDSQIKTFYLFACTDRVNYLLSKNPGTFDLSSPAASRLLRLYTPSEKITEPGCYGENIQDALLKLSIYYWAFNDDVKFTKEFFEFTLPLLEKNYRNYSRRTCNSRIIQLLECYSKLYHPLEHGLKRWNRNTLHYGKLIEDNLDSILKQINIKFVREQVLVDPTRKYSENKLDGYFVIYDYEGNEKKIYVEIKLTEKFKGEKSSQILQWLQLNPEKNIVLIVFSPTNIMEIQSEIVKYCETQGLAIEIMKRIDYIHVENPYAFAPISYLTNPNIDPDDLFTFYRNMGNWIEFFSDFSLQFQKIMQNMGLDIMSQQKSQKSESIGNIGEKDIKEIKEIDYSIEERLALHLVSTLYLERSFTPSGKMNKSKIDGIIVKKSMGITDLEKILEILKKKDIILKITPKQVQYDKEIISASTFDNFKQKIEQSFRKSNAKENMKAFM